MILIISSEEDLSTSEVIEWLVFYKIPYIRISKINKIKIIDLKISNLTVDLTLEIRGEIVQFNEIKSIWYRRSRLVLSDLSYGFDIDKLFDAEIKKQLLTEKKELFEIVWDLFKSKSLNTELDNSISKLKVLKSCKKYSINIPKTIITTNKKSLIDFRVKNNNIITKNFSQGVFINYDGSYYSALTSAVTDEMINDMEDEFIPIMLQEMIVKSFEVRAFYLDGRFYSSAIFSQNDEKTKVDFRNYNYDRPNRTPPYQIPKTIERQLDSLMRELSINCGSLDLIVDESGKYYFLEVNPVGQFKQVSHPCNYMLEKKIAKHLIK